MINPINHFSLSLNPVEISDQLVCSTTFGQKFNVFFLQEKIFPEERSADGTVSPHQRGARPRIDDPRLLQPLLAGGNGEVRGFLLPVGSEVFQTDSGFVSQINRDSVEEELQAGASGQTLFYHRGL